MVATEASTIDAASAGQIATSPNLVSLMDELGIVWRDQRPDADAVSRRTRWLSWVGGVSIGIGLALIAVAQYWIHSMWFVYIALGAMSVAFLCLLIFMMTDGREMLRELRTLDRDLFQSIGEYMQTRYACCLQLRESYTEDQIRFAHAYLRETLAQLRPRMSTFVGPLEKSGDSAAGCKCDHYLHDDIRRQEPFFLLVYRSSARNMVLLPGVPFP